MVRGFEPRFDHLKFHALKQQAIPLINKITIFSINITARFYFYSHCDVLIIHNYIHNELRTTKILEPLTVNIFIAFDISIYN